MKIHGPNHTNLNPYQKQMNKQTHEKKETLPTDQLQISNKAKQMQADGEKDAQRAAHVQKIKQAVESGDYQINPAQTADKMLSFWSTRS